MAVFEQMMGAVLAPHDTAEPIVPTTPEPSMPVDLTSAEAGAPFPFTLSADDFVTPVVPVAPIADETPTADETELPPELDAGVGAISAADLDEIPAPPVAEAYGAPEGFVPTGDYETDLRSLGLGELPPELIAPAVDLDMPADTVFVEDDSQAGATAVPGDEVPSAQREPMSLVGDDGVVEQAVGEAGDLDDLIRSLGEDAEAAAPSGVISSGTDYGAEEPMSEGVISTDAFLAGFESDISLSGGLGDELTALTGGGTARARPMATVAKLPDPGEAPMLHRDQMVDRSLLERIIEGIENL